MNDQKRLFIAVPVTAAWPRDLPPGRILNEEARHITLVFLGNSSVSATLEVLEKCVKPSFSIGPACFCDRISFLPDDRHPRVAAGDVVFLEKENEFLAYQDHLAKALNSIEKRKFFPHITIARHPANLEAWKNMPWQVPFFLRDVHLFESLGNSQYKSLWSHPFLAPFEEIEHTADIAFLIRGANPTEIFLHAQLALAFKFPPLLTYMQKEKKPRSLDEVVAWLNTIVGTADAEIGCPFKAVSYHGTLQNNEWTMIVDV